MRKHGLYTPAWFTSEHLLRDRNGIAISSNLTAASEGESVSFSPGNFYSSFSGPYVRMRYREGESYVSFSNQYPFLSRSFGYQNWAHYDSLTPSEKELQTVSKDDWEIAEAELTRLFAGFDLLDTECQYRSFPRFNYAEIAKHIPPRFDVFSKAEQYDFKRPLVVEMRAQLAIDGIPVVTKRPYLSAAGPPRIQQANMIKVYVSVEPATRDLMHASHIGMDTELGTAPVEGSIEEAEESIRSLLKDPSVWWRSPLFSFFRADGSYELNAIERVGDVYLLAQRSGRTYAQRKLSAIATVIATNGEEKKVFKFRFLFFGKRYEQIDIIGAPWQVTQ